MLIFLTYVFVKGPKWLRALAIFAFIALFLFGCLIAANTFQNALERTPPAHAHPTRTR